MNPYYKKTFIGLAILAGVALVFIWVFYGDLPQIRKTAAPRSTTGQQDQSNDSLLQDLDDDMKSLEQGYDFTAELDAQVPPEP